MANTNESTHDLMIQLMGSMGQLATALNQLLPHLSVFRPSGTCSDHFPTANPPIPFNGNQADVPTFC